MIDLGPMALRGSYPPVVTPFDDTGAVATDRYAELVDWQVREGSHGVTVNGTTAEPSLLTTDERRRPGRDGRRGRGRSAPVLVATGPQTLDETLELTRHAELIGAAAVLVVTPYYVRPPQRGAGRLLREGR